MTRRTDMLELELREYFENIDELLPPSNFGRMVSALESQRQYQPDIPGSWHVHRVHSTGKRGLLSNPASIDMSERLLFCLDREWPVRRALAAIGERYAAILHHAIMMSKKGGEAFGDRASLVIFSKTAHAEWRKSNTAHGILAWLVALSKRARKGRSRQDVAVARVIQEECNTLWHEAFSAYCRALSGYKELVRKQSHQLDAAYPRRIEHR